MRKYITHFEGEEVDLDDPNTYKHLPDNYQELDKLMLREIGYALVYMDYFPDRKGGWPKEKNPEMLTRIGDVYPNVKNPDAMVDMNNAGHFQRLRIEALITNFAENRRNNITNVAWYKEQVFLFQDEIENLC